MAYGGGALPGFKGDALITLWKSPSRNQFGWNCVAGELPCIIKITQYQGQFVILDIVDGKEGNLLFKCDNRASEIQVHERKGHLLQVLELSHPYEAARIEIKFRNVEIAEGFFHSMKNYFRSAPIGQVPAETQNMPLYHIGTPRGFFPPAHDLQSPIASNGGYSGFAGASRFASPSQVPAPYYHPYDVPRMDMFAKPINEVQPTPPGVEHSKWLPDPKDPRYNNFQAKEAPKDESPNKARLLQDSKAHDVSASQASPFMTQDATDNATNTTIGDNIDPLFGVDMKEKDTTTSSLEAILDDLAQAIELGDEEESCALVKNLAKKRAKLTIEPIFSEDERDARSMIKLMVYMEDKVASGGYFTLQVDPAVTTIGILKSKVFRRLYFPPEVQRWIIGRRLPNDGELLRNLGINSSGDTVHLYISTVRDVGVRKKNVQELDKLETEFAASCNLATPEEKLPLKSETPDTRQPSLSSSSTSGSINKPDVSSRETTFSNTNSSAEIGDSLAGPSDAAPGLLVDASHEDAEGWSCNFCTLRNVPTRPGCAACGNARPSDYQIPANYKMSEEEKERIRQEQTLDNMAKEAEVRRVQNEKYEAAENFQQLLQTAQQKIVPNPEPFECAICFLPVEKGEGILLRECLHQFCRDCVKMTIMASDEPNVKCPYRDDNYVCPQEITEQEIRQLLDTDEFRQYHERCVNAAERAAPNSYHCQSTNCKGWCYYEDEVNYFYCPVCGHVNCLTCRAIHEGKTCKDHQDEMKAKAENDQAAKKTNEMIEKMLTKGEAMHCPNCGIILQKKEGCDWMRCSMCRIEICWATRGLRWGPAGSGDTSGGCRCRMNGKMCAPQCKNCH